MVVRQDSSALHEAVIEDLRSSIRGNVLTPADDGYDAAREVWNAMIDRRPALIVQPRGVADVIAGVNFARDHGLLLAIRGGGHNVAGNAVCEGGLMLDLSLMKSIQVDPVGRTARAEPGVLWQELDHETQAFGLATVGGTISTTGIAGLTLGGGAGWLTCKYGMVVDNLLSVDIVTADGELRHASADENPDLFWAVRGAGANFGVVTSFQYRLHPVGPMIQGGLVMHPIERARDALRFYRDYVKDLPDEVTTFAAILSAPDGAKMVALLACYCGADSDEGERLLLPLKTFGPPVADMIGPMPYTAQQSMLDAAFPTGRRNYWKSSYLPELSDAAIETLIEYGHGMPSPFSAILIEDFHGAVRQIPSDAMAFGNRSAAHSALAVGNWIDPADDDANIGWARELYAALQPYLTDTVYVNYLGSEGDERVRSAYGARYERLVALKTKYDPDNLFRMNQNIAPRS